MVSESDEAYGKIKALVKAKPEFSSAVVQKLAALVEELEKLDVCKTPPALNETEENFNKINLGFQNFNEEYIKNTELSNKLKTGQWPKFMVIACADARVSPTSVLGLQPGDAFIVRNIANMVPACETEAPPCFAGCLEFAVLHLQVKHILVIGHRECGGIAALVKLTPNDGNYTTKFIEKWVEMAKPVRAKVKAESPELDVNATCQSCEKENVNLSLANLLTYPFVVDAVAEKKISLHGGFYDLVKGSFETWAFDSKSEKAT